MSALGNLKYSNLKYLIFEIPLGREAEWAGSPHSRTLRVSLRPKACPAFFQRRAVMHKNATYGRFPGLNESLAESATGLVALIRQKPWLK